MRLCAGPLCLSQIKPEHIGDADHPGSDETERVPLPRRHVISARPCSTISECACHYTTTFENAHRTVLREVLYRHHPWFGRRVCIHGAVDKDGFVVFRCTLEASQADRALEVPAWMFDRTACPDPGLLAAQPYVSIEALAALSALLDLALKDQTPSAVLLSDASGARHQDRFMALARRRWRQIERDLSRWAIAYTRPALTTIRVGIMRRRP